MVSLSRHGLEHGLLPAMDWASVVGPWSIDVLEQVEESHA